MRLWPACTFAFWFIFCKTQPRRCPPVLPNLIYSSVWSFSDAHPSQRFEHASAGEVYVKRKCDKKSWKQIASEVWNIKNPASVLENSSCCFAGARQRQGHEAEGQLCQLWPHQVLDSNPHEMVDQEDEGAFRPIVLLLTFSGCSLAGNLSLLRRPP